MPCRAERLDQVAQHDGQRGRIEVHRQGKPHLVGLRAIGDRRQQHDLRSAVPSGLADLLAHQVGLEDVGPIGQVQVVRLRGPQGKDRDLITLPFDNAVVDFRKFPGTHAYLCTISWISAQDRPRNNFPI